MVYMQTKIQSLVKDLRAEEELSVRGAASLIGIQHSYLAQIESGRVRPGVEVLARIAKAFKLSRREEVELFCAAERMHPTIEKFLVDNPDVVVNLFKRVK